MRLKYPGVFRREDAQETLLTMLRDCGLLMAGGRVVREIGKADGVDFAAARPDNATAAKVAAMGFAVERRAEVRLITPT